MAESALSMLGNTFSIPALIRTIKDVIHHQPTTSIRIQAKTGEHWWLDFNEGQLLWAGGGHHRFRRWQRLLRQTCSDIQPSQVKLRETNTSDHWEYFALSMLVQRQQLGQDMASTIIEQTILEVLFDIFHSIDSLEQITQTTNNLSQFVQPRSNSSLFYRAGADLQVWQTTNLGHASPNLAPVIIDTLRLQQSTQPRTYQVLQQFLQGKHSLRELGPIMGHDLTTLGRILEGYIESDTIVLNPIDDLSAPYAALDLKAPFQVAKDLPLIVCIDDSTKISYLMEETLRTAGYRCISVQDSVQALVQIIRHKPQMIFLSSNMPIANGYEICKQVRRAKAFSQTPIVILLDNDSFMERARAKSVGATTSMAKPITPSRVIDVVRRELAAVQKDLN